MGDILNGVWRNLQAFWASGVEPLHHLTWQTFSLFALLTLAVALFVTTLLHYSWVFSKPTIRAAKISPSAHDYGKCLRLSARDHLEFHHVVTGPMSELARQVRTEDESKYYVVSIVQTKPVRELIYAEMRLQAPPVGIAALQTGKIQLDPYCLTEIRRRNSFSEDNDPSAPIEGEYDIYIRPVRWFDVRHWLMHPNREIRVVVWVSIITTTVPTFIQIVFG